MAPPLKRMVRQWQRGNDMRSLIEEGFHKKIASQQKSPLTHPAQAGTWLFLFGVNIKPPAIVQ
ncbi:MAG TPA: hypothetical protein VHO49_14205, partial [Anaerolineales bacterium]|nr:hypothetical protein [Anaerolineales bacterium]